MLLCQSLEYVRGFRRTHGLAKMNCLLIISGAFGLFRKAPVLEVGGLPDEDGVRGHELESGCTARRAAASATAASCSCPIRCAGRRSRRTGSPASAAARPLAAARTLESLWMHRTMFLNPRGAVGLIGFPFHVLLEAFRPADRGVGLPAAADPLRDRAPQRPVRDHVPAARGAVRDRAVGDGTDPRRPAVPPLRAHVGSAEDDRRVGPRVPRLPSSC